MNRIRIESYLEEHGYGDQDILLADGFEEAFIGVVESFGAEPKACYSYDTCIDILLLKNSEPLTHDEAVEFLEFNVTQAYVGEHTPAFIRLDLGEQKF